MDESGQSMTSGQFPRELLTAAHNHCGWHRDEIERSDLAGCFYCCAIFPPSEIAEWMEEHTKLHLPSTETALCPRCGIDSVIGSASGYPIDADFLRAMHERWF